MGVSNFKELSEHVGHDVEVVAYGKKGKKPFVNASIQCNDCGCVLLDFDKQKQNIVPIVDIEFEDDEIERLKEGETFDWTYDNIAVHIHKRDPEAEDE